MEELKSLIISARAGDIAAYEHIVQLFQDMACGYSYSIVGDFHLAEDIAQDAFIEAYKHLHQLRDPAAFPGWFRRILFKYCDRAARRKQIHIALLDVTVKMSANDDSPVEAAERYEIKEKVLKAIHTLPDEQRIATALFYINGYSQKDIAKFLEVPVTTVKKRLSDSRNRLKERMMDMVEETLKENIPDERFSQKIISELLNRPRPLEITEHPVRQIWDQIRAALPNYEVITGEEVEGNTDFQVKYSCC